jgi:hypothetical protein
MKINKLIVVLLLSIFAASCTERIDINLDSQKYARLVVEGSISTDTTAHIIKLTKTADYFDNQPPEAVSEATVVISGEDEDYQLTETPAGSGIYLTAPDVYGKTDQSYELKIQLKEEIGGHNEYSASSTIFPIHPLDSIALEFKPDWGKDGFWEVKCYVQDPETEDFYMFQIYRNNILVTDSINEFFVTDDVLYNGNYTNGIGVGYFDQSRDDQKLVAGDKVTLQISRITKEYTDFVIQVQTEISFQTPLFSGPPANVQGNINNGAFGFFTAASCTYSSTLVK